MNERPNITVLKTTELWKTFIRKAEKNIEIVSNVEVLINYADELLERIIETFPTYTIHNGIHQLNVVDLMGKLLNDKINELTLLECVFLLLSAYYHDIGMVFTEDERADLKNDPEFKIFINEYPEAHIILHNNNYELTTDIAEWYCRWIHAMRVHKILLRVQESNLKFGSISLRESLGNVCESHNMDIEDLKDDNKFSSSFLGEADMKFCSILLRLADILDFDRSRSPDAVYKYLNLDKRRTKRTKVSDIEWRKHLSSDGFKFPAEDNELKFVAGPDHPAVEHDVQEFIDTIDSELNKCRSLLKFCAPKWQNFTFPEKINRKNIIGQGYKYGNFKFTLDQEKILELLMGENLYENRYVFIRELIQNSIDTSRYRNFHEDSIKNTEFKIKPIKVSDWIDKDGYKWIRIDDYGMGMDESKIINYLLKVGNSYYNSSEFTVDKILYQDRLKKDFTPISRFGIGLLSCFIAADKVEISTMPLLKKTGEGNIRLSIDGLHNYYIMQSGNDIASQMPNKENNEEGYRKEYGTSIAVRINPAKEFDEINLEQLLSEQILASVIDVQYNGKIINEGSLDLLRKPLVEYHIEFLTKDEANQINQFFENNVGDEVSIEIIPIDLSKNSTSEHLLGQFILINLNVPQEYKSFSGLKEIGLTQTLNLKATKEIPGTPNRNRESLVIKLGRLWERISEFIDYKKIDEEIYIVSPLTITHNGIVVPLGKISKYEDAEGNKLGFNDHVFENQVSRQHHTIQTFLYGKIALSDMLRPDVSTSRDRIKPLKWDIISNITLTFLRAFKNSKYCNKIKLRTIGVISDYLDYYSLTLENILSDELIQDLNGWENEKLINVNGSNYNVSEIKRNLELNNELPYFEPYADTIHRIINETLLQKHFNLIVKFDDEGRNSIIIESIRTEPLGDNIKLFEPLEFIPYINNEFLRYNNRALNLNHKFSRWYVNNAIELKNKFPGIFNLILNLLRNLNSFYWIKDRNDEIVSKINSALNRLRELNDESVNPPVEIDLKITDIFITKIP